MDLFPNLSHLLASAGILLTSLFGHGNVTHQKITHTLPVPTVANTKYYQQKDTQISGSHTSSFYNAARSINYDGHTIYIAIAIPKAGGNVTGTITGDCKGKIVGNYDGLDGGAINGQADVVCNALFMQIPKTASFTGVVSKTNDNAQLFVTIDNDFSQNIFVNFK